MGSCLKMPVGNCDQCVHFAVCKLAEKWRSIKQTDDENCGLFQSLFNFEMVQKTLMSTLLGDVVAVTRCKDCKHWVCRDIVTGHKECTVFCGAYGNGYPTRPYDYCSFAERKEC